jgi:hypothetical protein
MSSRARGIIAGVLGVLAILVLTVTTIAVWAWSTAFNSEKVADIVGDALADPEVEAALAEYLTTQVMAAVDVEAAVDQVLPSNLQRLGPVIAGGARTAVDAGLTRVLSNPDVQRIVTELVERAHSRAVQLLQGDGLADGITVVDGAVSVNLLPLVSRGLERVQDLGLFQDLDVPDLTVDGDPSAQIAELEQATGRDLPDDFGQLVVYRSDRLADAQTSVESAQRIFVIAKRAVWLLVALTLVLLTATVLVARDRWRAALWLGLGGVAAMVVARNAIQRVVDEAPELATRPGGRAAISAILGGASTGLLRLAGVILVVGVAAAVVALFRRQWRREDLVLAGAVLAFVLVVAVLGLTLVALLLGLVLAVLVPVVVGRFV